MLIAGGLWPAALGCSVQTARRWRKTGLGMLGIHAHVTVSTRSLLPPPSASTQRSAQRVSVCARILRKIFEWHHAVLVPDL